MTRLKRVRRIRRIGVKGRRRFLALAGAATLASLAPKTYRKGYYHPSLRGELDRRMRKRRREMKGATT